jgi:hypothetical protein
MPTAGGGFGSDPDGDEDEVLAFGRLRVFQFGRGQCCRSRAAVGITCGFWRRVVRGHSGGGDGAGEVSGRFRRSYAESIRIIRLQPVVITTHLAREGDVQRR